MFKIKPPIKVITPQIPDGSITEEKLADGAVTTAKIEDGAVTQEKMAVHLFEHTITTLDYGSFKFINNEISQYKKISELPRLVDVPVAGTLFIGSHSIIAVKVDKATNLSTTLTVTYVYVDEGELATNTATLNGTEAVNDYVRLLI